MTSVIAGSHGVLDRVVRACSIAVALSLVLPTSACREPTTEVNVTSGALAWRAGGIVSPTSSGALASDSEHVYAYSSNVSIVALRVADRKVDWTARATDGEGANTSAMRGIVKCGGLVIFGSYRRVYAVDAVSGRQIWSWLPSLGGALYTAAPTCVGGTLFVATLTPMFLYAVDAVTGTERFVRPLNRRVENDGFATTPHVDGGVVATCTREFAYPYTGMVAVFDASSGTELWRYTWSPPPPWTLASCTQAVVMSNNTVVVAVDDGRIFGLDQRTGALLWTAPRVGVAASDERPMTIVDGIVVAGSLTGVVTGIDVTTGATLWSTVDADYALTSINLPILGEQHRVFATTLSGSAVKFDVQTGRRLWLTPTNRVVNTGELFGPGVLTPSLYILVGADGIYAFNR